MNKDLVKDRFMEVNNGVIEVTGKSLRAKRLECSRRAKKMRSVVEVENRRENPRNKLKHGNAV